jgi:tripartite-type tricarboxylate transporter receptor subunit TctC
MTRAAAHRLTVHGRGWVVAAILLGSMPAAAQQDFYAGKTVTVLVGSPPGGGYDMLARLMVRHFGRHIPGHPAFVVQNMPAASSLAATNHLFNLAPRDGTTIGVIQRGMITAHLMNPSGVRFDVDKLNWLGSLHSETGVTLAWHTAPHRTATDLMDRELIVGGMSGIDPELTPRLYNALLGTRFKIILGYGGTPSLGLAMERGEVQGVGDWSWSSLKKQKPEWLRENKVRLLLQGAMRRDPELPDVPHALDFITNDSDRKLMHLYFTQKMAARPVVAPPGVPPERLALLRTAFVALAKDAQFLAEADRTGLEVGPISGEDVGRIIGMVTSAPHDVLERFVAALRPPNR